MQAAPFSPSRHDGDGVNAEVLRQLELDLPRTAGTDVALHGCIGRCQLWMSFRGPWAICFAPGEDKEPGESRIFLNCEMEQKQEIGRINMDKHLSNHLFATVDPSFAPAFPGACRVRKMILQHLEDDPEPEAQSGPPRSSRSSQVLPAPGWATFKG